MAEQEERLTKLFLDFLGAQDDGYQGSFEEYHWDRFGEESPTVPVRRALQASDEDARVSDLLLLTLAGCTSLHFNRNITFREALQRCPRILPGSLWNVVKVILMRGHEHEFYAGIACLHAL